MDSNEETCLSESAGQSGGTDMPLSTDAAASELLQANGAHPTAAIEGTEVHALGSSAAVDPTEALQVHDIAEGSVQQLPNSEGSEGAPDGQNEPVRSQSKQAAKLQPTAALVYPWISASMRRSGTGTASFRTVSCSNFACAYTHIQPRYVHLSYVLNILYCSADSRKPVRWHAPFSHERKVYTSKASGREGRDSSE